MSDNLRSHARLIFKTKKGTEIFSLSTENSLNSQIMSVSTKKDLAASAGNFKIVLNPRTAKDLISKGVSLVSDLLEPYDLVQIQFKTGEEGYKTEMIGVVSRASISLSVDPRTGAPTRNIIVTGYDLGKIIQDFHIYFNWYITANSAHQQQNRQIGGGKTYFAELNGLLKNKTAKQFIQTMLSYFFKESGNLSGGPVYPVNLGVDNPNNTSNISNYIDFLSGISSTFQDHTIDNPYILLDLQGGSDNSLWDLVRAYSDKPYHETFVDLRRVNTHNTATNVNTIKAAEVTHVISPPRVSTPLSKIDIDNPKFLTAYSFNQPYVFYMRTTPFSKGNWTSLNYHTFDLSEVTHQDTSTDSDNIYNYFEVISQISTGLSQDQQLPFIYTNSGAKVPIFDIHSISKFGFRKFPMNLTKYVQFVFGNNLEPLKKQAYLMRELFRWYCYGEDLESGVIVLKGRVGIGYNGITIGSKLIEQSSDRPTGKEYYIESLSQDFEFGVGLKTTIGVTRGTVYYGPEGRFAKIAKLEAEYGLSGEFYETIIDDGNSQSPLLNTSDPVYKKTAPIVPGDAPAVLQDPAGNPYYSGNGLAQ